MAAIAVLVLVVAQPLLRDELAGLFGGSTTHHIVLLDDSFSMSDRWENTSAWDQGRQVVQRLGDAITDRGDKCGSPIDPVRAKHRPRRTRYPNMPTPMVRPYVAPSRPHPCVR